MSIHFNVGDRVTVKAKGGGTVAFLGKTSFATGDWVGIILDSPAGKNDGTVEGNTYFTCEPFHGIFVRPSQVRRESVSRRSTSTADSPFPPSPISGTQSPVIKREPTPIVSETPGTNSPDSERHVSVKETFREDDSICDITTNFTDESCVDVLQVQLMKKRIVELEKNCQELAMKLTEDRQTRRDLERTKLQVQQLQEYKNQAQQQLTDLKRELQSNEKKCKQLTEMVNSYKDELAGVDNQIESLTLDKEMSDEKAETLELEVAELKKTLEEVSLEYDILKTQVENPESVDTATTHRCEQQQKQIEKLNIALLQLRDSCLQDKKELAEIKKQLEDERGKGDQLSRTNQQLVEANEALESENLDLKEQVDAGLGADQMISALTDKNLNLEEKVAGLEERLQDMIAMTEIDNEISEDLQKQNKELRNQVETLNVSMLEEERKIEALKYTIADRDQTILKFRELVKSLQDEKERLDQQIHAYEEKDESLRSLHLTETRARILDDKLFDEQLRADLISIELRSSQFMLNSVMAFLPDQFCNKTGEFLVMRTSLLLDQIVQKAELLQKKLLELKKICSTDESNNDNEYRFVSFVVARLCYFRYILRSIRCALLTADDVQKQNIALNSEQFSSTERSIAGLLELVRRKQVDERTFMKTLDKLLYVCKNILDASPDKKCGRGLAELVSATSFTIAQVLVDESFLVRHGALKVEESDIGQWRTVHSSSEKARSMLENVRLTEFTQRQELESEIVDLLKYGLMFRKIALSVESQRNLVDDAPLEKSDVDNIITQIYDEVNVTSKSPPALILKEKINQIAPLIQLIVRRCKEMTEKIPPDDQAEHTDWIVSVSSPWKQKWTMMDTLQNENASMLTLVEKVKASLTACRNDLSAEKVKAEYLQRKLDSSVNNTNEELERMREQISTYSKEIERLKMEQQSELVVHRERLTGVEIENMELKEQMSSLDDGSVMQKGSPLAKKSRDELTTELTSTTDKNARLSQENSLLRAERVRLMLQNLPDLESNVNERMKIWKRHQQEYNRLQWEAFSTLANLNLASSKDPRAQIKSCLNRLSLLSVPVRKLRQDVLDAQRIGRLTT